MDKPYPMRLQKFLARAGAASRRGAEDLMTEGRVKVNGQVVKELGSKVDPEKDVVTVDDKEFTLNDAPTYLMLYKPADYLSTMRDPHNRKTVAELVPTSQHPGLFPVGRLDADTTGLLLFTTDGDLAQCLLHPSFEKEKSYLARVKGTPTQEELAALEKGVALDDGTTAPAKVRLVKKPFSEKKTAWLAAVGSAKEGDSIVELVIHEGKKHQVKRMLEAVGHPVLALFRPTFGPLELTDIEEGKWRYLSSEEIETLRTAVKTPLEKSSADAPEVPPAERPASTPSATPGASLQKTLKDGLKSSPGSKQKGRR